MEFLSARVASYQLIICLPVKLLEKIINYEGASGYTTTPEIEELEPDKKHLKISKHNYKNPESYSILKILISSSENRDFGRIKKTLLY